MAKKIHVATEPRKATSQSAEKWVGNSGMKRLTIDIDPELHTDLKQKAALNKTPMKDVLVRLIKDYVNL